MTVNEQLFVAGLIDAYDEAVARRSEGDVRRILAQVFLGPDDIDRIVRRVLGR